jgi:L-ascorbate metabolism protein UlaG (beta-lactamase superfamily)
MRVRWFGQSAFLLTGEQRVAIDPFGPLPPGRDMRFAYPPIQGVEADLLLVTHEHFDHSGVDAIGGAPQVIRSTAGTLDSPIGEVVAVASEHDDAAGTKRGPNTIFVFSLDGLRLCHMGDFGQAAVRAEQRRAIGAIDVLFLPVGGRPTMGGAQAADVARELTPRLIVPMHFRTPALDFLEPPDRFLETASGRIERLGTNELEVEELTGMREEPVVALLEPPAG